MSRINVNISNDVHASVVKKGCSLIYACNNANCQEFRKNAITNLGYISFDYIRESYKLKCEKCSTLKIIIKGVGFYKAKWTIKYINDKKEEINHFGLSANTYEARGPILLNIWKLVKIIVKNPNEIELDQTWKIDKDLLRKLNIHDQNQEINVWSLRESIQQNLGIKPEHQFFYYKGQRVYKINTSLSLENDCASIKNIQNKCRIISFNIRPLNQSFLISIENYEKSTVLDALSILVQLVDIKSIFEHNIIILKLDGNPLEFEDNLNKIQDYEEIFINFISSAQQITFLVKFGTGINKKFTFNESTITKDLLYILSLYYKINYQRLKVLNPDNLLPNLRKTISQNGITLRTPLILE